MLAKKIRNLSSGGVEADDTITLVLLQQVGFRRLQGRYRHSIGDCAMVTWSSLTGGAAWVLQLEGIISCTGTTGRNMISILRATDSDIFSSMLEEGHG